MSGAVLGLLLFIAGVSGSGLFVLGCFVGMKIQREHKYVIQTRVEKELLDQATVREEKVYNANRAAGANEQVAEAGADATEYLAKRKTTHPMGLPQPPPDGMPSPKGQSWIQKLGTTRARG